MPLPRARPVADAPSVDAQALAHAWLVELVAGAAGLREAGALPVAELAGDAPRLAGALAAALGTDAALGELRAAAPLAARPAGPAGAVAAAEALRRAGWAVLRPGGLEPGLALALADRLARLCALVAEEAVGPGRGPAARDPAGEAPRARDLRPAPEGQAARRAIGERLASGEATTLVLVEVDGLERLEAAQEDGEVTALLRRADAAVAGEAADGDTVTVERPGRVWVATTQNAAGLAARAIAAVAAAATHHRVPLTASAGMATVPADGADVTALAAVAEERLLAARAAGPRSG